MRRKPSPAHTTRIKKLRNLRITNGISVTNVAARMRSAASHLTQVETGGAGTSDEFLGRYQTALIEALEAKADEIVQASKHCQNALFQLQIGA